MWDTMDRLQKELPIIQKAYDLILWYVPIWLNKNEFFSCFYREENK